MKKVLIALCLFVLAGGFFVFRASSPVQAEVFGVEPRVEIVSGTLSLIAEDGSKTVLVTGETLQVPANLLTDTVGVAIVYFADGSEARLDPSTSLTVEEGTFDEKNGSLKVRLSLAVGRVWSKVVDLATTESRWQVETAHTVATVRGTAFGVEAGEKRSAVLGSQHSVAVAPKDPVTGKIIKEREVLISEKQYVEVDAGGKGDPVVKQGELKPEIQSWANENETKDASVDVLLERPGITREERRAELLNAIIKKIEPQEREADTVPVKREEPAPISVTEEKSEERIVPVTKPVLEKPVVKDVVQPAPKPLVPRDPAGALKELVVIPARKLGSIEEGETVSLKAFAVYLDGTRLDVTDRAVWRVVGEIGAMKVPGIFIARLSEQVSELGSAKGVVAATLKDAKSGEELLGKTDIFEVRAKVIIEEGELRG